MERLFGGSIAVGGGLLGALNDLTTPLLGVPLTTVAMAIGGALASFGYGDKVTPRKKMYMLAAVNAFLAIISVAVLPEALGWSWVSPKIQPALGAMFAVGARFVVPHLIDMIPKIIKRIFKLDEYRKGAEDRYDDWDFPESRYGRRYYGQGDNELDSPDEEVSNDEN